ncbi:MAG: thioesterase II family protein [Bacillota bacterium]|uniref:thioesterase II family protein n=1 Tax=Bacillus safensis TaxID=561879 RepID=UPI000DACF011
MNIKVFCLGYAGSSKTVFRDWIKKIHDIEFIPLEYKGRGTRLNEFNYANFNEAIDDICRIIKKDHGNSPYAIFGHSMGGYIAYELFYKLSKCNIQLPKHLFLSGINPPMLRKETNISHLDDDRFLEEVIKLGGISKTLLSHRDILNVFLPTLKNDFRIVEEYKYEDKKQKVDCNMTIILGTEDTLTQEYNRVWSDLCKKDIEFYKLTGNHFFLHKKTKTLQDIIIHNIYL